MSKAHAHRLCCLSFLAMTMLRAYLTWNKFLFQNLRFFAHEIEEFYWQIDDFEGLQSEDLQISQGM